MILKVVMKERNYDILSSISHSQIHNQIVLDAVIILNIYREDGYENISKSSNFQDSYDNINTSLTLIL